MQRPPKRKPFITVLKNEQHFCKFILDKTDVSVANSLRRVMIAEVPTLCIDMVEFTQNTTCLNDEYIAHRLGMIPLRWQCTKNNENKYGDVSENFTERELCERCTDGCEKCTVVFNLRVDFNEKAASQMEDFKNSNYIVTSAELESEDPTVSCGSFINDEEAENSHDTGITIVKMGPGQVLELTAFARMGISKEHAKWCPVSVATYRFWPETYLNHSALNTLTSAQKQTLVDACPDRILELDPVTNELQFAKGFEERCTYTEDLEQAQNALKQRPEDEDFISVKQATDKFIFEVESTGCMHADEIVMSGIKVLNKKLNALKAANLPFLKGAQQSA
jgi:DNA-directed RNA polymerase II subunit RPB3